MPERLALRERRVRPVDDLVLEISGDQVTWIHIDELVHPSHVRQVATAVGREVLRAEEQSPVIRPKAALVVFLGEKCLEVQKNSTA